MDLRAENIILIGFMGTGKTTIGIELSKLLEMEFLDTDQLIEKLEGMTISDIFNSKSEEYFRRLEFNVIMEALRKKGQIISTGGGAVLNKVLFEEMKKNGVVIGLTADIETLWSRLNDKSDRPLLSGDNPKDRLIELYKKREPLYRMGTYTVRVDGKKPDELAAEIIKML